MTDFERDVIQASFRQPVLVDFNATWCGPCRMLGPVLEQAVRLASGPMKLVIINTDENSGLAASQGVSGIPDVRLFVNGQHIGGFKGFRTQPEVERFLKEHLALASRPS